MINITRFKILIFLCELERSQVIHFVSPSSLHQGCQTYCFFVRCKWKFEKQTFCNCDEHAKPRGFDSGLMIWKVERKWTQSFRSLQSLILGWRSRSLRVSVCSFSALCFFGNSSKCLWRVCFFGVDANFWTLSTRRIAFVHERIAKCVMSAAMISLDA